MKQNKYLALMMATLIIGLAGCSSEDNGNDSLGAGGDEGPSKLTISIKVPQVNSRAGGQASDSRVGGTAQENAMNTVDVYVFKGDGLAVTEGAHGRLQIATDFTVVGSGASAMYTSKAESAIETRAGSNRIYVGVNLPETFNKDFPTEASMLSVTANVGEIFTDGAFYFFSDREDADLQPYDVNATSPIINKVELALDRVAAKVAVSAIGPRVIDGKITIGWTEDAADNYNATDYDNLQLVYEMKHFRPYQDAFVTYVAPNYVPSGMFSDNNKYLGQYLTYSPGPTPSVAPTYPYPYVYKFDASNLKESKAVFKETALPTDLNTLPSHYIGESRPYVVPKFGNTTYVMVATQVLVNMAAEWKAGEGAAGTVEYAAVTPYGNVPSAATNVHVVKVLTAGVVDQGKFYITDTEAKASAIVSGLGGEANAKIFTYREGYVHFPVYLDGYGSSHEIDYYGVFRNQFIRVNVTDIVGNLTYGQFPGIPGNPDDPTKPGVNPNNPTHDPNDPTGPNNPEDPVDASAAQLVVEILVNPWYYLVNDDTILQ